MPNSRKFSLQELCSHFFTKLHPRSRNLHVKLGSNVVTLPVQLFDSNLAVICGCLTYLPVQQQLVGRRGSNSSSGQTPGAVQRVAVNIFNCR